MPYDEPYYIEETGSRYGNQWTIYRRGDGIVCTGTNFEEMVKLMEGANAAQERVYDER